MRSDGEREERTKSESWCPPSVTMRAAPTVRIKDAAGNIGGMHRAAVGNVTSGVAVGWSGNADANTKGISQVYKTNAWATGNMLIGGYEAVAEL